jgi:uncharacterized cupredoxin-like copper-binding protein
MKKVLSLVLVIAMVLSSMSFAFAGTFEDVTGDYEKAIEALTALGVVTGYEDGTYRPEKVVTRAEMAKLMVEILGYGDLVAGSKSNFADTQGHWADAWIALAAGKNIVIGDGNGNFRPNDTVSYNEAITMVVRALGYTDNSNELKVASWPTNFKIKAAELGLTDDVVMNTTGADRGGVAQLLYNALTATLVTVNSDGDVVKATTQTTDGDGDVVVQYTELLSRIADYNSSYEVYPDRLDEDSKKYGGDSVDLEPYMYQNIKAYVSKSDNDLVVFVKSSNSEVVEGKIVDLKLGAVYLSDLSKGTSLGIAAGDDVTVVIEDANEKDHEFVVKAVSLKAFYNSEEDNILVENFQRDLFDNDAATTKVNAVIADANDNGIADDGEVISAVVAARPTSAILVDTDYVEGKTKINGVSGNIALPTDDGDVDLDKITVTGAVDTLEEITADDVVVAYRDLDQTKVKLVVVRESVEGLVTKTNTTGSTVYIDDKSYSVSDIPNAINEGDAQAGDEGTFYLDDAGKVFALDTEGEDLTDYAVVIDYIEGTVKAYTSGNKYVSTDAKVVLRTADGEKVTYPVLLTYDGAAIDDQAIIDDDGDGIVEAGENLLTVAATAPYTVNVTGFAIGDLIRYSVDEDGYIEEVELLGDSDNAFATYSEVDRETLDSDDIADITTEDTLVFYTDGTDYDVVSLSSVEDGAATVVYYTTGSNKDKIAVIYTESAASENDGVYGVIKSVSYVWNNGEKVKQVTAFVDGEEVVYLTDDSSAAASRNVTTAQAVKFTFNTSDELTGTTVATTTTLPDDSIQAYTAITTADSSYVTLVGGAQVRIAAGVAVYTYDESADTWTIGDASDIDDSANQYAAYALDYSDSSRIDIVVQFVD